MFFQEVLNLASFFPASGISTEHARGLLALSTLPAQPCSVLAPQTMRLQQPWIAPGVSRPWCGTSKEPKSQLLPSSPWPDLLILGFQVPSHFSRPQPRSLTSPPTVGNAQNSECFLGADAALALGTQTCTRHSPPLEGLQLDGRDK